MWQYQNERFQVSERHNKSRKETKRVTYWTNIFETSKLTRNSSGQQRRELEIPKVMTWNPGGKYTEGIHNFTDEKPSI